MAADALSRTLNTPADTLEVDFALVLSRLIESLKADPAELRHVVYEVARIRLQREGWNKDRPADFCEMRRMSLALETAISRVEAFSATQDQLQALKSLDRLIGSGDQTASIATAGSPDRILIIDHPARGRMRLPGLWAFANRLAPAARVLLVTMFAIVLYAAFSLGHHFFRQAQQAGEESARPGTAASAPVAVEPPLAAVRPASPAQLRDFPLPSFYGMYALSNGELYELDPLPLRVPDPRIFMSGLLTKSSRMIIPDGRVAFVAYRRDLAANAPDRASVRVIARIIRALSFAAGRKPNVAAVDDSWAVRNISYDYRVAPLGDQPEMLHPPGKFGFRPCPRALCDGHQGPRL